MVIPNVTSKLFDLKLSFPVRRINSRAGVSATVLIAFCLFVSCSVFLPFFSINVSCRGEQKILCGEQLNISLGNQTNRVHFRIYEHK